MTNSILRVRVTDESGEPVVGALVRAHCKGADSGFTATFATDNNGFAQIENNLSSADEVSVDGELALRLDRGTPRDSVIAVVLRT